MSERDCNPSGAEPGPGGAESDQARAADPDELAAGYAGSEIAIIGMSCRFPGAADVAAFWRNLRAGAESLAEVGDQELLAAGVTAEELANPAYVRRVPALAGSEDFDARFFGYTPQEATIMDPQHRLFLECAWEALEQAGYDSTRYPGPIGVFTGAKTNTYLFNVVAQRARFPGLDNFQIALGNDLAAMATRVSYKLDLRGPSYALHTACSTSLVAVHLACQSLLLDECSMALAGGAALNVPQRRGYVYQKGGLLSPDGSCRTFDARAAGSNFGNGAGAVLLKRLADALRDGDTVYAVIRGSATNNDGARKASFTAPGVAGQTAVLLEAMASAGVDPADISYVEAHGTATDLGDSIELLALTQAFRATTERRGYCAIGSVKTNLGHLETAAGVASLIKTALALWHRTLPPSLHFERPNPKIDFAASPFVVNTTCRPWPEPAAGKRRTAGVSSFGIGSTNAHVVVEEAPPPAATDPGKPWQPLLLSARSPAALEAMSRNLGRHLAEHPEAALADVAFTLAAGRRAFEHRRCLVCRDRAEAAAALAGADLATRAPAAPTATAERADWRPAFLVPGLGEHYVDMGLGLYRSEPLFRDEVDRGAEALRPWLGVDLREVLYPRGTAARTGSPGSSGSPGSPDSPESPGSNTGSDGEAAAIKLDLRAMLGRGDAPPDAASARLDRTLYAQPATFVVEHALARLLLARGVAPQAMIGYSLGEYVCACLAGVLSPGDALSLVARRAALVDRLPAGAMLAVNLDAAALAARLAGRSGLSLAADNGPGGCVAAGGAEEIAELAAALGAEGVACRRLAASHAFHTERMAAVADELTAFAATLERRPPAIPYVSNLTGTWITAEQATDPAYWARHLVSPVRFADGLDALLFDGGRALIEVGPGQGLSSFARLHPRCAPQAGRPLPVVPAMRPRHGRASDAAVLLGALGALWQSGVHVDWTAHFAGERRRRVPLPTYPFERQRYWLDPDAATLARTAGRAAPAEAPGRPAAAMLKNPDLDTWLYRPVWRPGEWPAETAAPRLDGVWLLLADRLGVADALASRLAARGAEVVLASPGEGFTHAAGRFTLRPGESADYEQCLGRLGGRPLARVVHLCGLAPVPEQAGGEAAFRAAQELGFYSLLALAKALVRRKAAPGGLEIDVVTHGVHAVAPGDPLAPERATVLGPAVVIPQEHPQLLIRAIDLDWPASGAAVDRERVDLAAGRLLRELLAPAGELVVAHRGDARKVRAFDPAPPPPDSAQPFRAAGVYLITGGLGGIGLALAERLARTRQAKLVLTRRTPLPPREQWDDWLRGHDRDDRTSRALAGIRALEAAGAEVLALAADVADEAQMRAAVQAARDRFGELHGVIHAAGVLAADGFKTVQATGRAECELHFAPKVYGLYVLERVLAGLRLDFVALYSSLSAVLGGLGYAGYAAANLFMDSFAELRNRAPDGTPWRSIDWDSWHASAGEAAPGGLGTTLSELAMTPDEGFAMLRRLLALPEPRPVVVSTGALAPRLAQWVELRAFRATAAAGSGPRARPTAGQLAAGEELERQVAAVWRRVLGSGELAHDQNFFDLGGNSLLGMQLVAELARELGVEIEPVALFESPTVAAMARHLGARGPGGAGGSAAGSAAEPPKVRRRRRAERADIAVIGMHGRFPGARSIAELWRHLRAGRETIARFSDQELLRAGVDEQTLADPRYVKARPILDGIELFDAPFFGYTPREAEIMDPQHRVFLESAWAACEDAGYDIERYPGAVGVYAGASLSSYMANIYSHADLVDEVGTFQTLIGNEKDSLTTKVSYNLNLRGPSLAVQTFCSTSLVAVHLACRALIDGECDMALAGGVSIIVPQVSGYAYEPGGIGSQDGHIRAFDAAASGIVFGNGLGTVLLKRLEDALADGDSIRAVIKGTAVNNDGAVKAGFSATSVEGQAEVVAAALEVAGVDAETLGYMEAHGTGTPLGDPIEIAALDKAFRAQTAARRFCPIGSVKTNLGHLDRAAGVTGLIKTVLALEREEIPPSLHFATPNPAIDFADSAFWVIGELAPWPRGGAPRRAGVNSLGLGGTNAHAVLEEAPAPPPPDPGRPWQLLPWSARTPEALEEMTDNLAAHLAADREEGPGQPLAGIADMADIAYTLQVGRKAMPHRRCVVVPGDGHGEAAALLRERTPLRVLGGVSGQREPRVVFLMPGLGGLYPGIGRGLYEHEPVFRAAVDQGAELLRGELGLDLRAVLYGPPEAEQSTGGAGSGLDLRRMLGRERGEAPGGPLRNTAIAQPALFVVEHALARLLDSWGVRPRALLGYSLGEYAAACAAGSLALEDGLRLVARRARMIAELPPGAMLAVPLAAAEAARYLSGELSLAATNGPRQSVVAGPLAAVAALERQLAAAGLASRRLETSHAFHSTMMEPLREPFLELLREVSFAPPQVPWLSNLTGGWMGEDDAADGGYWARHMCHTVRFSESLDSLAAEDGELVLLELGPGQTLASLALQHPAFDRRRRPAVASALRHGYERRNDLAHLYEAVGRLWLAGVEIDWRALHGGARRRRVPLPTYPFARHAYWVESRVHGYTGLARLAAGAGEATAGQGLVSVPGWRRNLAPRPLPPAGDGGVGAALAPELDSWLLCTAPGDCGEGGVCGVGGVGAALAERLRAAGRTVWTVEPGPGFAALGGGRWSVAPGDAAGAASLAAALPRRPAAMVHLWSLAPAADEDLDAALDHGLAGLLALLLALRAGGAGPLALWTVSAAALEVSGEASRPAAATVLAATRVVPRELPGVVCRAIDVAPPERRAASPAPAGDRAESWADRWAGSAAESSPRGRAKESAGGRGSAAGSGAGSLADVLLAEIAAAAPEQVVAYRGGCRWVPSVEPAPVPAVEPAPVPEADGEAVPPLRRQGAYLLTGGTGSRGFAFASYLARHAPGARLALVDPPAPAAAPSSAGSPASPRSGSFTPSNLAAETSWSARRTRRVEALRAAGAEVLELTADPTDEAALHAAVAAARRRFGPLHGVVHAAEPAGAGAVEAAFATIEDCAGGGAAAAGRAYLALKAEGARHLDSACAAAEPLDFALLVSSLAPLAGGLGVLFDAAAGFYLDALARRGGAGVPWTSIAWDFYLDDESDAVRSPGLAGEAPRHPPAGALAETALHALFELIPRAARLIATPRLLTKGWNQAAAAAGRPTAEAAGGSYPRPELTTAYVAPRSATERRIAGIWEGMLGVARVGVHDGFLELGGDSLLAARMVARLREAFALELPVRLFFEAANVEQLSREVERRLAELEGDDDAAAAELEVLVAGLSEDEVEAELARRTSQGAA
jgi:acyl transferase domain-containing protein/acyl carrier protein